MIYEIRDYTIEKEWLEQYVKWVKESKIIEVVDEG